MLGFSLTFLLKKKSKQKKINIGFIYVHTNQSVKNFRKAKMKRIFKKYEQVIKYLFFGISTTVVAWVVYFGVMLGGKAAFGIDIHETTGAAYFAVYTAAQLLQWIAAVLFAFFTNRKWVFTDADNTRSTAKQLGIFAGGRVLTLILDYAMTYLGTLLLCKTLPMLNHVALLGQDINMNELTAKLVTAVVVVIVNYFFSKIFVFKKKREE